MRRGKEPGSSQELEKTLEDQGQERPGGRSECLALDVLQALAALQVELSSEHEKNRRAYVRSVRKSHQRRKHHLVQRSAISQSIPGYWAKAVSLLMLLGVRCSGRGGGAGAGEGMRVRVQERCWMPLKEVWSWAIVRFQRHRPVESGQGHTYVLQS